MLLSKLWFLHYGGKVEVPLKKASSKWILQILPNTWEYVAFSLLSRSAGRESRQSWLNTNNN